MLDVHFLASIMMLCKYKEHKVSMFLVILSHPLFPGSVVFCVSPMLMCIQPYCSVYMYTLYISNNVLYLAICDVHVYTCGCNKINKEQVM